MWHPDESPSSSNGQEYMTMARPGGYVPAVFRALGLGLLACLVLAAPARASEFPVLLSSAAAPDGLHHVVISGSYAYGVSVESDALVSYARGADGSLAPSAVGTVPGARDLAVSPDGRDLYVVAEDDNGTALADYRLAGDGTATFAGCLGTRSERTPTLGFDQPSDLAVSPDGRDVYVAAEYRVVDFRRAADGSLSAAGCAGGADCHGPSAYLDEPHAIAVSPGGGDVYVTDGYGTVLWPSKVVHFTRAGDGSLRYADCVGTDIPVYDAPCTPLPAGVDSTAGPLGLAVSPDGRDVYVSGGTGGLDELEGTDAVTHFRVGAGGALRFADCIGDGPSGCPGLPSGTFALRYPRSLAIDPAGTDLYTSAIVDGTITHFALGPDGALSFASCVGSSPSPACSYAPFAAVNAQRVTVSPDGLNLYAPGGGRLFTFGLQSAPPTPVGTPPTAELSDPAYVEQFSVQLRGHVVPNADHWTARFEYGPTTAYGSYTKQASEGDAGDGFDVDATVLGLAPGTTYHYRLMSMTPAGAVYTPDATFTTQDASPGEPDVETMGALGNAGTGTALAATVRPRGGPTTYRFQWGETSALGRETPARSLPGDNAYHSVTEGIDGLTPGTDYWFRVAATNSAGTVYGATSRFTAATPAQTAATPTPSPTPTPTPTPQSATAPPAQAGPAAVTATAETHRTPRARITHLRLRHARRGFVVTYRDTRHRTVLLVVTRGHRPVLRIRHHSHPGRNRIHRGRLRPGAYVVRLQSASGAALARSLRVHVAR
jgi:hypothetical protein